ncbi:hypothetical protein BT69DRAFT_1287714, partial [Atractiella rhizophila]
TPWSRNPSAKRVTVVGLDERNSIVEVPWGEALVEGESLDQEFEQLMVCIPSSIHIVLSHASATGYIGH